MGIDRLMSILLILINESNVTAKSLANHFEVSLRTIYRDIEKLCQAGVPIASNSGVGGGYYIMEGYKLDKSFLSINQAKPFIAVMEQLNTLFGKDARLNELTLKLDSLKKTQASSIGIGKETDDNKFLINLSHFNMESELRESLGLSSYAIENELLLEFDYVNRRLEKERRLVEPYQISFSRGEWYLWAFCKDRQDFSSFKLIRMSSIKSGARFEKKELTHDEIHKVLEESFYKNSCRCVLKFEKKIGMHLREYFSSQSISEQPDGSYLVEEVFPDNEGLLRFILGFGVECQVLAPIKLREELKEYTKDLYKMYES